MKNSSSSSDAPPPDDGPSADHIHNPHDKLFKQLLGERENAASFLEHYLPRGLLRHMDLEALEVTQVSFIDSQFVQSEADLLITVPMKGRMGYVYILFEHQSGPDSGMPLRLLSYMVRIWKRFLRDHPNETTLPAIVPMVLFHGAKGWEGPRDFQSMVDAPAEDFAVYTPHFLYRLFDFSPLGEEVIAGNAVVQALLNLFASVGRADGALHVERAFKVLGELLHARGFARIMEIIVRYVLHVHDFPPDTLRDLASQSITPSIGGKIMTTYEQLIQKGKAIGTKEGMEKGMEKGREEAQGRILQRLLRKRFPLDAEQLLSLLSHLSFDRREELAERIFEVEDADEIRRWIEENSTSEN